MIIKTTKDTSDSDGLVIIYHDLNSAFTNQSLNNLGQSIQEYTKLDSSVSTSTTLIIHPQAPGSRVILSPLMSLKGDVDDVRRFYECARKAIAKCSSVGIKNPCFSIQDPSSLFSNKRLAELYQNYVQVVLLGVYAELYIPLQAQAVKSCPFKNVGFMNVDAAHLEYVNAIEQGRILARDIGGSDPERMAPLKCAQYIVDAFNGFKNVNVSVITDVNVLNKEYPLLHAVARCSLVVSRHQPAVVRLEYRAPDQSKVKENLFFIGKGVTYDTGGADIKAGGAMRGMSRDKCGAAACAGFMKTVALLNPKHVNVTCDLGFVRNSAGPDNYVSDEIITSRAGVRVLIGNTDAEGRMVMGDLLCHAKERVLSKEFGSAPSRLFTVATLTGHAIRAMGVGYSISMDNGPAREAGVSKRLFEAGHLIADPFETSTLRREDYELVKPGALTEDVVQANDKPSTMTNRGHQYPGAFLSIASGISKHGLDSQEPICYTHIDMAGSAEEGGAGLSLSKVTGSPISAFTLAFLGK